MVLSKSKSLLSRIAVSDDGNSVLSRHSVHKWKIQWQSSTSHTEFH